jgi:hypothetical protein
MRLEDTIHPDRRGTLYMNIVCWRRSILHDGCYRPLDILLWLQAYLQCVGKFFNQLPHWIGFENGIGNEAEVLDTELSDHRPG